MDVIIQKIIDQFDPNLLMLLGLIAGVYYLAWKGGEWSAKIKYSRGKADKSKRIPDDTL